MARIVTVGGAQLGPIARTESRASAVARMIVLLRQAAAHGSDLVVFPECALTAFFPHWYSERQEDIDAYFEREMPNAATQPLFDCARELRIGFYLAFFNRERQGWRVWPSCGFRIGEIVKNKARFFLDYKTGLDKGAILNPDLEIPCDGSVHRWGLEYDPEAVVAITGRIRDCLNTSAIAVTFRNRKSWAGLKSRIRP